jgi:hypothetical protein
MSRNRKSAKDAGQRFNRSIVDYIATALDDDRIDVRAKRGAKDRGDVSGMRVHGQRLVVEAKNCARMDLPGWTAEADVERGNDDALVGVVVAKRRGVGDPGKQWVVCTVDDLLALIAGQRFGHRLDGLA